MGCEKVVPPVAAARPLAAAFPFYGMCLLFGVLLQPTLLSTQTVDKISERFTPSIVRISTEFSDGRLGQGFGFVIREEDDSLFVVTAAHVVIHEDRTLATRRISLGFHGSAGSATASLLGMDSDLDLALLLVRKRPDFRWTFRRAVARVVRGDEVWIVGRNWTWNATAEDFRGQVSQADGDEIVADFAGVEGGASGGPLLSRRGIAGMVLNDEGNEVTALKIDVIRQVALRNWLGLQEIDVRDFPFVGIAADLGLAVSTGEAFTSNSFPPDFPPLGLGASLVAAFSPVFGLTLGAGTGGTQSPSFRDRTTGQTYQYQNRYTRLGGSLRFSPEFATSAEGWAFFFVGASHFRLKPELKIDDGDWISLEDVPGITYEVGDRAWWLGGGLGVSFISHGGILSDLELGFGYTTSEYFSIDIVDPFTRQEKDDWLFEFRLRLGYAFRRHPGLRALR